MKKLLIIGLSITAIATSHFSNAQPTTNNSSTSSNIHWVSKSTQDPVTIANGNGVSIVVEILVDKTGSGINLKNCGMTTHVDAGSSAICSNTDSSNSVSFTSDSMDKPAMGTYQIKQQ